MAAIRKELGRHRWTYRPLPGLPGAHEAKKRGERKQGFLCTNCRQAWDPDDGDPPVTGCLLDNDAMRLGPARMKDLAQQEGRLLSQQAQREFVEEIAAGARDQQGRPILE